MRKRILSIILSMVLTFLMVIGSITTAYAVPNPATPVEVKFNVDGVETTLKGFTIMDYDYYNLYDIARALKDSKKSLKITYDVALSTGTVAGYSFVKGGTFEEPSSIFAAEAIDQNIEWYTSRFFLGGTSSDHRLQYKIYPYNKSGAAQSTSVPYIRIFDAAQILNLNAVYNSATNSIDVHTEQNFTTDWDNTIASDYFDFLHSAVVGNSETGDILYSANADEKFAIASTTKVMTYLVVKDEIVKQNLEADIWDSEVTISKNVSKVSYNEDGTVPMDEGDKIKFKDLMDTFLVYSTNEAGSALAEKIAGSEKDFVQLMNDKAAEIGLSSAKFYNVHGLPEYTKGVWSAKFQNNMTGKDLFKLYAHVLNKYPEILEITKKKSISFVITSSEETPRTVEKNAGNRTLFQLEGVDGLKTGYTFRSGSCLVSTKEITKPDGTKTRVLAVVMGAEVSWERDEKSTALLQYASEYYNPYIEKSTVTFVTNGGSLVSSIKQHNGTRILVAPTTTRANYIFDGWYTDVNLTNKILFPYTITQNTTLYAKWLYIGSSDGGSPSGNSPSVIISPTPSPTISTQTNDQLVAEQIKNNKAPTINLNSILNSATLTGETLKSIMDSKKDLTISNSIMSLNLTSSFIESLNLISNDKIEIIINSSTSNLVESIKKADLINEELIKKSFDLIIKKNGVILSNFNQPINMTIDISSMNFTDAQKKKLTGVKFLEDGKVKQLGGKFVGNKFTFYTQSLSKYGVIVSDTLVKITTTIGNTSYSLNDSRKTTDVAPIIIDGRTMVPVRFIAEALGADVTWIQETKTVGIKLNEHNLSFNVGQKSLGMDVAPIILNDRTLVPLRYISEQIGANVVWNEDTKSIDIYK